jgi:hypothetical protein
MLSLIRDSTPLVNWPVGLADSSGDLGNLNEQGHLIVNRQRFENLSLVVVNRRRRLGPLHANTFRIGFRSVVLEAGAKQK